MTVQVICDFDGTIAERDMIQAIMQAFVPEETEDIIRSVQAGALSVRDGVEAMFGSIPSSKYDEVVAFARAQTVIREGFPQFIHTCGQLGWSIAVVSGGFDFFVDPVIHNLSTPVDCFRNRIDATGPFLRVEWAVPCDEVCEGGCGLCKPTVMRQLGHGMGKFVVIGDGVTDFKAARLADFVFARSRLLDLAMQADIPVAPFETFYEIDEAIRDRRHSLYDHI